MKPEWVRGHEEEFQQLLDSAIENWFKRKGVLVRNALIFVAGIVGAIAVITGGFKWLLAFFGFAITRQ